MAKKKTVKKKSAKKPTHKQMASQFRAISKKTKAAAAAKDRAAKAIDQRRLNDAKKFAEEDDRLTHEAHEDTRSLYQQFRDWASDILK